MNKRHLLTATLIGLLSVFSAGRADAHPHVWVEARAVLQFDGGRLTAIRQHWQFDEFFSSVLYEDFDRNKNGKFEADEVAAMRDGAFTGLGEVNFFTDLRVAGAQVAWPGAQDFAVEMYDDGTVAYTFTLPLPQPVEMTAQSVTLSLYDPDYYVSVEFEPGPSIEFQDLAEASCRYSLAEDEENAIYFGAVFPVRATFDCSGTTG